MRNFKTKKLMAVILLLCMALSVMMPAQIASATSYKYGAKFSTYSKTATYMKYGKTYKTKKKGYHYFKLEIPDNMVIRLTVDDKTDKKLTVDIYDYDGSYLVKAVDSPSSLWKYRGNGKYRHQKDWSVNRGLIYFRLYKSSTRDSSIKVSFVRYR